MSKTQGIDKEEELLEAIKLNRGTKEKDRRSDNDRNPTKSKGIASSVENFCLRSNLREITKQSSYCLDRKTLELKIRSFIMVGNRVLDNVPLQVVYKQLTYLLNYPRKREVSLR